MSQKSRPDTVTNWKFITPRVGRDFSDDDWRILEPKFLEIWREAQDFYDGMTVEYGKNRIKIHVNFEPIFLKIEDTIDRMKRLYDDKDPLAFENYDWNEISVPLQTDLSSEDSTTDEWRAAFALEYVFYELFLSINLSAPGSCNFHNAYIIKDPPEMRHRGGDIRHDVNLTTRSFEAVLFEAQKHPWLQKKFFDYRKTVSWMNRVSPRFDMIPSGSVSRSVFALMHLAKSEEGPMSIIWIFYALESLFKCRTGENFNSLSNRISLLFDLNQSDEKSMRKRLRELYDLRSSIVHGGAEIVHPLRNEVLDKRADDASWRYVEASDFGSALVVRSLQEMIDRDWTDLHFKERIVLGV